LFLQTSVGPPFSGAGSADYSVFFFGANWKVALSVASAAYCCANAKFGPGVPSSFTIFFDKQIVHALSVWEVHCFSQFLSCALFVNSA